MPREGQILLHRLEDVLTNWLDKRTNLKNMKLIQKRAR